MRRRADRRFSDRFRAALLALSSALFITLSLCFATRSDAAAAVTIWPVWIWVCVGVWLALSALCRERRRAVAILASLWLAFLLVFAEEPWSLARGLRPTPIPSVMRRIRIVSLNCAGGDPAAAAEVSAYKPDIVLMQEAPSRADLSALSRRLFGSDAGVVYGPDACILARGTAYPLRVPGAMAEYASAAFLEPPSGQGMRVISLRLRPQPVRLDLWSPDCWRQYASIRRAQREQTKAIAVWIDTLEPVPLTLVGGDFNAPQRDGIFSPLRSRFHDAFAEAGVGWGNTIINEAPMLRIDQVWLSGGLRCVSCVSRRTVHSDHRMVVCDVVVRLPQR